MHDLFTVQMVFLGALLYYSFSRTECPCPKTYAGRECFDSDVHWGVASRGALHCRGILPFLLLGHAPHALRGEHALALALVIESHQQVPIVFNAHDLPRDVLGSAAGRAHHDPGPSWEGRGG